MGTLVAMQTDTPFSEGPGVWAWMANEISSPRLIWYQRHGFSPHMDNVDFFRFLIPGVGDAPLNAFRILITLFVVAIGPVNYFVLRRFRRLHLLIVTVPVSAAGVTMALFAYAFISDGLGTRVRVRSVTHINQVTGRTECWARLSYYCGLAPSGGLLFPEDVAVHPMEAFPGETMSGVREVTWYDGQRLTGGWLRSRTPSQFITVRSRRTELGIEAAKATDAGVPVVNRLQADVQVLLLRDQEGDYYLAEAVDDGRLAVAQPVEPSTGLRRIRELIDGCDMSFPPGMDTSNFQYRYRRRWFGNPGNAPQPTAGTSLLERSIAELGRNTGGPSGLLEPRSYVAVVDFSPEVELGTPNARPEASLHLVIGNW